MSLRVGAAMAVGLLVAASTPVAENAIAAPTSIAGMIVFLDPGHNGANDASLTKQVPTGRGGTKDCQTSGTSSNDGYPEHTFTWMTVLRIRQELTALGVRTAMSRGNDTTVARASTNAQRWPTHCIPTRSSPSTATAALRRGAGSTSTTPSPPLNDAQKGPSVQFAQIMRDQMQASGLVPATYIGQSGLYGRADLTGLNLAQYPSILVECGNMKNVADAALMESPEGQQKYADAVVKGIAGFLGSRAPVARPT